jgi:hypothetical protein
MLGGDLESARQAMQYVHDPRALTDLGGHLDLGSPQLLDN